MIALLDLDGTISDDSPRRHLLPVSDSDDDYAAYHDDCDLDRLLNPWLLERAREHDIAVVTGRPETYREQTERWLWNTARIEPKWLLMRPNGSNESAPALKSRHARALGVARIAWAADDDPEVCAAYQALGIPIVPLRAPEGLPAVPKVMEALFPAGLPPESQHSIRFHLFELVIIALAQFAASEFAKKDFICDAAVYCGMLEKALNEDGGV